MIPSTYTEVFTFLEDILNDRERGETIRPARVEGEVGGDFRRLFLRQRIVERSIKA
jgi:hypothetical protein